MARVTLSPPWDIFVSEVEALFKHDDGVKVVYDENERILKLYIDDDEKYDALYNVMRKEIMFGNVTLRVELIPSNQRDVVFYSKDEAFEKIFKGNTAVDYVKTVDFFTSQMTYVVFAPIIAQFFTDDISDIHGYRSMLYHDIAKDVFGNIANVNFCVDVKNPPAAAFNWP
jgi:hypothetical protein